MNSFYELCYKAKRMIPVEKVHHIVPASHGGTHELDNLMSLRRSCHEKIYHNEIGVR